MDSLVQFPTAMQYQNPEPASVHRQLDQSGVAISIAQMLLALHCREEGVRPIRLRDMAPQEAEPFRQLGEMAVQMIARPGLKRIGTMAAAAVICRGEYGNPDELSIVEDVTTHKAAFFFHLAETAIRAYQQTIVFQSPDADLDRRLDDRLQTLELEGLVQR